MAGKIQVEYKPGGKKTIKPVGFEGSSCHDATRPYESGGAAQSVQVSDQEATDTVINTDNEAGAFSFDQQSTSNG